MMKQPPSNRIVFSVVLGFALIANIIGTSSYMIFPTWVYIAMAFSIGIAMVLGITVFFVTYGWTKAPNPASSKHIVSTPKRSAALGKRTHDVYYAKRSPAAAA